MDDLIMEDTLSHSLRHSSVPVVPVKIALFLFEKYKHRWMAFSGEWV